MSSIKFDLNDLQRVVSEAAKKTVNKFSKEDYTKTSYLPKGTHDVSFFFDPEKHMFRDVEYHKFDGNKVKCLCPDQLNFENKRNPKWAETVQGFRAEWAEQKLTKLPDCEICNYGMRVREIDKNKFGDPKKGAGWKLKLLRQKNSLLYANLYTTSNEGKYWQPNEEKGEPYVIIGNSTLKDNLVGMFEEYGKKAGAHVIKALNPTLPSPPFTIINNDKLTITTIPQNEKPAIIESETNPPAWWRPLSEVFIKKDFNLEDYETNVQAAKKIFEDYSAQMDKLPNQSSENNNDKLSGGEVENFLARDNNQSHTRQNVGNEPEQVQTKDLEVRSKQQIEDPKPPTSLEKQMEEQGDLKHDQRVTRMGEVIQLPDFAVERNCWTKFKNTDPLCAGCPVNFECTFEQD